MAFQETEHGCKVVAVFERDGEFWSNNLWGYQVDFDEDDMQDLVDRVKSVYIARLLDDFSIDTVFMTFKAYDMRTIDGVIVYDAAGDVPCTGGTEPLSSNNACVLTLYTAKRGRSHRGRLYLGPFKEENLVDGVYSQALIDQIDDLATDLLANFASAGFDWGVRSGQLDGVTRDPAIITPITSTSVRSPKVASQRRRVDRP